MSTTTSGEKTEGNTDPKISWRCTVCGFVFAGEQHHRNDAAWCRGDLKGKLVPVTE